MKAIIYDYPYVFKDNHNEESNVIFVHGFNSSPATFRIFEEYWKKSNYYAIQFPGNNNTNPVNGHEISVYQYAKLLVEFVEKNKLKNVTLIGHSMGGGTISLAYEMKPELFSKMIYIAPMNKSSLSTVDKYFETYFPKTFDQFLKFLEALYYDTTRFTSDSRWMNLTQKNFDANYFNNDNILKLGRSLPNLQLHNDIEKGLQAIKVPTLLILGEKDAVIDRDNCLRYFENNVEDIKTIYIPQTGHMMFEENWKSFISILEPFLLS
ncbi:alpha/beta hydrolase [Mycoplasmopsis californica]|uniref:Alpha/beta hydrolase n=1 Tax=Mycoplasmopsis californica TaxID=2113 RepID=A0A059XS02_9BACT|nr:alpha/beta hydrolase [Mycoplasmopsis californica]AIA29790.1 alpha/beta hydrolase [Mycoplasmopsis californica]